MKIDEERKASNIRKVTILNSIISVFSNDTTFFFKLKTDEEQTVSGLGDFSDSFGFPIRVGRLRHRRRLPDGHPHL